MKKFNSVSDLVRELQPVNPVYCIRPESIKLACNFFVNNFPGKPLYAVKTNPHKNVIKHIYQNGITNFDVASLEEIKLVKSIAKDAKLYFMHTVKNRKSIEEAYFNFGIRDFSFDTKDELIKIFEATKDAKDLTLYLRIFVSNCQKFGFCQAIEVKRRCFKNILKGDLLDDLRFFGVFGINVVNVLFVFK